MFAIIDSIIAQHNKVTSNAMGCHSSSEYVSCCLSDDIIYNSRYDIDIGRKATTISWYNNDFVYCNDILPNLYCNIDYSNIKDMILQMKEKDINNIHVTIDIGVMSHLFVLIYYDNDFYIVDSYAYTRCLSYRKIDINKLMKLLEFTTIPLWNKLFLCNETHIGHGSKSIDICWDTEYKKLVVNGEEYIGENCTIYL